MTLSEVLWYIFIKNKLWNNVILTSEYVSYRFSPYRYAARSSTQLSAFVR